MTAEAAEHGKSTDKQQPIMHSIPQTSTQVSYRFPELLETAVSITELFLFATDCTTYDKLATTYSTSVSHAHTETASYFLCPIKYRIQLETKKRQDSNNQLLKTASSVHWGLLHQHTSLPVRNKNS